MDFLGKYEDLFSNGQNDIEMNFIGTSPNQHRTCHTYSTTGEG